MKAILCSHFGTPDELELADIPQPVAGPGEAVVRVKAAALNFFDTLIIAGKINTSRLSRSRRRRNFPASSKASARRRD